MAEDKLDFKEVKEKEDASESARIGAEATEYVEILEQTPVRPAITGERFVPTFLKSAFNRGDGTIGGRATAAEARKNQPLMHALRSNPDQASLKDVEPGSDLVAQHQAAWLERSARGFTELGENPYSDNWLDNPFNWTALELQAINRGIDVGTLIEFEAADSLYAGQKAAFDANVLQLEFGRAQVEIQFDISDAWMGWEDLTEGKLPENFMDAIAASFPHQMQQAELDQFISEFGIEVEGNPDMLNDAGAMSDLLGRMIVRLQQVAGQALRKREIRERGFGSNLADFGLGILDPLLGPTVNFEDQGILSGLEGTFQPFEDAFIKPASRQLRNLWQHTADPTNPFRPHISLGQNIALSSGQDANTWGYSFMSGAIDLSTYIVFDPLSYIGSLAKGLGMTGKLALGTEAIANGSRTTRVLKAMVPFGRGSFGRGAVGLGWSGNKGWSARVMYQVFAKDVDTLIQGNRALKMGEKVTSLAKADRLDEAIRLYPSLAKNAEILSLAKVSSADEWLEIVGEAMKGNMKGNKTLEVAERAVRNADKNLDETIKVLAETGTLDLADLTHLTMGGGRAVRNVDMVELGVNGSARTRGKQLADGSRTMAWTERPIVGAANDPKVANMLRSGLFSNSFMGKFQAAVSKGEGGAFIEGLSRGQIRKMEDFISSMGYDMVRFDDGVVIIGTRGKNKLSSVVDGPGTNSAAQHLGPQLKEKVMADYLHKSAQNITDELYWIDSLPKRSTVKQLLGIKPLSMKASANAGQRTQSWWRSFRRNRRGWLTGGRPKEFALHDAGAAVEQIKMHGRFAGIEDDIIARWVRDFTNTVPEERARFYGQMMEETADLVGDWRMKHQMRYNNAHAGQNMTYGDDGIELAMGPSRSRPGVDVAKPHEPGMLGENFPGWDKSWYDEVARLRTARARIRLSGSKRPVTGRSWTRTSKKRQQLVEKYRRALGRDGIDTRTLELGDDDLWAMAYATIDSAATQGVNGLGTLSHLAGGTKKIWGGLHRGFTLTALATRGAIWPLKVVFGEEQIRGQLAGMLNMYAHPIKYFRHQMVRHTIQRARKSAGAITEARGIARVTLGTKMDDVVRVSDNVDDLLRSVDDLVPGFRAKLPEEFLDELTPQQVRNAAREALDEAFDAFNYDLNGTLSFSDEITRGLAREVDANKAIMKLFDAESEILEHVLPGFDEINSSMFKDVAEGSHIPSQGPVHLSRQTTQKYSVLRMDEILREAESPFMKFALDRAISNLTPGARVPGVNRMIQSAAWRRMRGTVEDIATGAGKEFQSDKLLAMWFFDDWYRTNIIDTRFRQFMRNADGAFDPEVTLKFMTDFRTKKLNLGDETLELTRSNQKGLTGRYQEWIDNEFAGNRVLDEPLIATGSPSAMNAMAIDQTRELIFIPRDAMRHIVRVAGNETTQKITRQPAFLASFDNYFRHFKSLGWSEERAAMAARIRSVEDVNHIMYNMDNAVEAMRTFNNIVPFGAAMVEVGSVWFWHLPILQGGAGLGHVQLANKLKRFEYAMQGIGVMGVDEDGNTFLNLREGGFAGQNLFGKTLSTYANKMFQAPELLARQLQELQDELFGEGEFVAPPVLKQHSLRLGNPMDIATEGLFAVNGRFAIGLTPVAGMAATWIGNQNWLTADSVKITLEPGQTLTELAALHGLEPQDLYADLHNQEMIRKKMPELYRAFKNDRFGIDFTEFSVSEGVVFNIPNTSAIRNMFEDLFFPYGPTNDLREAMLQYAPSGAQQIVRSFGLTEDSESPLGVLLGPMNVHSMGTAMLDGMAYANMVHGYADTSLEAFNTVGRIQQELFDAGDAVWEQVITLIEDLDGALVEKKIRRLVESESSIAAGSLRWEVAQDLIDEQEDIVEKNDTLLIEYGMSYGQTRELSRGLTNMFIPGSPRAIDEQKRIRGEFWDADDMADQIREGQGVQAWQDFLERPHADLSSAMDPVLLWAKLDPDARSSEAKKLFLDMPHMAGQSLYYTQSRSYTGNPFPEFNENDVTAFVASLKRGESTVLTPDAFIQANWHTQLTWEQEISEAQQFGEDPIERGINFIWRRDEKAESDNGFRIKRSILDYYDFTHMDGAYMKLRSEEFDVPEAQKTAEQARFDSLLLQRQMTQQTLDTQLKELDMMDIDLDDKVAMKQGLDSAKRVVDALLRDMFDLRDDFGFGDESDQIVNDWFETIFEPHIAKTQEIWDQLNDTETLLTDDDRAGLFGQIRTIENQQFLTAPLLEGHKVPNVIQWYDIGRTEEERRIRRFRAIGKKPAWLNLADTTDLMNFAKTRAEELGADVPEQWLPTTPKEMELYTWYNNQQVEIKRKRQSGDPDEFLKQSQVNKVNDNLDKLMREALEEQGRYGEARYLFDFTTADQLAAFYLMPEVLTPIYNEVNIFLQQLAAIDKTTGTEQARLYWQQNILPDLLSQVEVNGPMMDALIQLGTFTNKKSDPKDIIETIFLGRFMPLT